jgi:hypothetical protein
MMTTGLYIINTTLVAGLSFVMLERITSIITNLFAVLQPQYLRFFKERMKNGKN